MIYIFIAASIFVADWFIKDYIEKTKQFGKEEKIFNGNIILNKHHNKGAMLNFMDKNPNGVMIVSGALLGIIFVMFALLLPKKNNRVLKFGMSLLVAEKSNI
jgi:signal peptidase II